MLAVDIILRAIIGPSEAVHALLTRARNGEESFVMSDVALYCALKSVQRGDNINLALLAELLRYSHIDPDCPRDAGTSGRVSWEPGEDEIKHWRATALTPKTEFS